MMQTENTNALQAAIDELGAYKIAKECGVKGPSVYKWRAAGHLPRTEWTGETDYAGIIAAMSTSGVTREQLRILPADAKKAAAAAMPSAIGEGVVG